MSLWRDFCFGLRLLAKKPGFTVIAVLALALGIGPSTALFSIVHAAFFECMDYQEPDRLVMVWYRQKGQEVTGRGLPVSGGDFLEYRKAGSFERLSAYTPGGLVYTGGSEPEDISLQVLEPYMVSKTLQQRLLMGRDFLPEEAVPGKDRVILLSYEFWQTRLGGDPKILGKQVRFSTGWYTVVGVGVPPKVSTLSMAQVPLVFSPPMMSRHGAGGFWLIGRLKHGVTVTQAQTELDRIAQNLAQAYPATNKDVVISVDQLQGAWVPKTTKTTLWLLAAAVGFVLLIACANLANLMLARATTREREIAVRAAIGASAKRLFAQVLVESLTVALAGCVVGAALGWALLRILLAKAPSVSMTAEADPRLSLPVLLFAVLVAVVSALLFGSVPAWRAGRQNLTEALKQAAGLGADLRHLWLRRSLVVLEFAAAMTLLAAASVSIHTLWKRSNVDARIPHPENVLTFVMFPPQARMANLTDAAGFYRELISATESVPGVERVSGSSTFPLSGLRAQPFAIPGRPAENPAQMTAGIVQVTEGYFETYGLPVRMGRSIDSRDRAGGELVAMVSEEFAERYFPNQNPLVQQVSLQEAVAGQRTPATVTRRVVGVYRNMQRLGEGGRMAEPEIAVPAEQVYGIAPVIAARCSTTAETLQRPIAKALSRLAPDSPMRMMATVAKRADDLVVRERLYTVLFGMLAGVALLLSAVGIYGVMAFLVTQRTREIGLRVALGAGRKRIVTLVVREGVVVAGVGLAAGFVGAYFVGRSLQAVLTEVERLDFRAFGAAGLLLLLCSLVACLVPALRASKVNPMNTLRMD